MKTIRAYFKSHPKSSEVHETSNGFLFHKKHDAEAHANELDKDSRDIKTHKREDVDLTVDDEEEEKKASEKKNEGGKAEGDETPDESWKLQELKDYCSEKGIALDGKEKKKEDVLAKIKAAETPASSDASSETK